MGVMPGWLDWFLGGKVTVMGLCAPRRRVRSLNQKPDARAGRGALWSGFAGTALRACHGYAEGGAVGARLPVHLPPVRLRETPLSPAAHARCTCTLVGETSFVGSCGMRCDWHAWPRGGGVHRPTIKDDKDHGLHL